MEDLIGQAITAGCNIWTVGILGALLVASEYLGKTDKIAVNGVIEGVVAVARKLIFKF